MIIFAGVKHFKQFSPTVYSLEEILTAICEVCDVTIDDLRSRRRLRYECTARGLFYMIALDCKWHPSDVSAVVRRSRASCIIASQHYYGYKRIGDIEINTLYSAIMERLKNINKNNINVIHKTKTMNTYIPDCVFPTDNDAEVPTLRMDMQPEFVDIPFVCFGEQKRTFQMNGCGTLHFYTDDYRFSVLYEHPEKILNHNPRNIVEPNFSLFNEMPVAFGLQAIYKKRFIARAMQERGIRVFVDLNVASKFYQLNLLGVPAGYSSFCTRGYSDRLNYLEFEYQTARTIAGDNPLTFVIYGGGNECRQFAKKNGCIYISPVVTMKKSVKALEKIGNTVAFFGEQISIEGLVEEKRKQIADGQLLDFRNEKTLLDVKDV